VGGCGRELRWSLSTGGSCKRRPGMVGGNGGSHGRPVAVKAPVSFRNFAVEQSPLTVPRRKGVS
jgi:hypothetical protein